METLQSFERGLVVPAQDRGPRQPFDVVRRERTGGACLGKRFVGIVPGTPLVRLPAPQLRVV
jgi:hypothetical protein